MTDTKATELPDDARPRVYNKHKNPPKDAIYVGRGSPWGNPYVIGKDGTRNDVCDKFAANILPNLDVRALRGKDLVCYCAPQRCHADDILLKANIIDEA